MSKRDEHGRLPPRLDRDYFGTLFTVVDDEGCPVCDYEASLDTVQNLKFELCPEWENFRIVEVGYKLADLDDTGRPRILDDPLEP